MIKFHSSHAQQFPFIKFWERFLKIIVKSLPTWPPTDFPSETPVHINNTLALFSDSNSLSNSYLTLQDFILYFAITVFTTSTVDQAVDVVSLQTSQGCKPNYHHFINSLWSLSNFVSTNPFVNMSAICRSVDACSHWRFPLVYDHEILIIISKALTTQTM